MRLGEHFLLREFLRSETAARLGLTLNPPAAVVAELERLVVEVLDPLRESVGQPVTILSGWRPPWLNRKVKGSKKSDHLTGRAADLIVAGMTNKAVCERVRELRLPVKQAILEFPPNGWVHLSIEAFGTSPRLQFLTAVKQGAKTVYLPGFV